MKSNSMRNCLAVVIAVFCCGLSTRLFAEDGAATIGVGSVVTLNGRKATVTKLDSLPFIENDFTKRFKYDSFTNPKLKELRQRYKLDEVVAPGKTEFDRQVLLLDWVNRQFKKFGAPTANPRGAAEILQDISEGHTFFCAICRRVRFDGGQFGLDRSEPGAAAAEQCRLRFDGAFVDRNLVEPISQMDHARPDVRDVCRKGRIAAERVRNSARMV